MTTYHIAEEVTEKDGGRFQFLLQHAYGSKERPLCLCRDPGIEMYIVKAGGSYYVKRMPSTGGSHHPACASYEPPAELSGLGQLIGSAIIDSLEAETTTLRLGFSLSKRTGTSTSTTRESGEARVRTEGNKLTMRSLLHYLWEEAGFHRWSPSMAGKRSWSVIRQHLLQAAEQKIMKGNRLSELLYVPEPFALERKDLIAQRRTARMASCVAGARTTGSRPLMLLIGEVKEISPSRYGHKLVVKHLPDFPFMMNADIHSRLRKRFEEELSLWDSLKGAHLVAMATFGLNKAGVAAVEEMGLMATNTQWLPFENVFDHMLLDTLINGGRRFQKCMRYNLASTHPMAAALLTDTDIPTALYICPPAANADYMEAMEQLIVDSQIPGWIWRQHEGTMPALPANAGLARAYPGLLRERPAGHDDSRIRTQ